MLGYAVVTNHLSNLKYLTLIWTHPKSNADVPGQMILLSGSLPGGDIRIQDLFIWYFCHPLYYHCPLIYLSYPSNHGVQREHGEGALAFHSFILEAIQELVTWPHQVWGAGECSLVMDPERERGLVSIYPVFDMRTWWEYWYREKQELMAEETKS